MSRTVKQIRHAVSRRVGDLVTGTLTTDPASGVTTLIDTSRVEIDGWFKGYHLHIGEDATSEDLRVLDSDQSATSLSVSPATAVDHGLDDYELHKLMDVPEYNSLIDDAILEAGPESLIDNLEYTSITLVDGDYEYALPRNFRYINEIWIADSDGSYQPDSAYQVPLELCSVIPGTIRQLRFHPVVPITDGRSVRILGQGVQALPTLADTSLIYLDPAYISKHVELTLMRQMALGGGAQAAVALRLSNTLAAELQLLRDQMITTSRPKSGSLAAYP